jgi:diguanylate cyclase (GGDEF)-like protein
MIMAMRDMLRRMTGERARASAVGANRPFQQISDTDRLALLDTFEATGVAWFWSSDAEGRLTYLSPGAVPGFGDDRPLIGEPLGELVETASDDGRGNGERPLSFVLGAHSRFRELVVRLRGTPEPVLWSLTGHPLVDHAGRFQGFRGSARDVSERWIREADEARLAQYDPLTGLANRHRMNLRLDAMLGAFRMAKRSCALLLLDLDRFKHVNDTLGHPAGDELLRQVGQRLQRLGVIGAEIGRLGGDEFQIAIPDLDDRGHLGDLAKKIIQLLSQPYVVGGEHAVVGASVGIAVAPYDGMTREELVKAADLALYAAKGGGRGQFRLYASDLASAAHRQRQIGEDLREALRTDQLDMHYQPIVRAGDNSVVAFEALMRWDHPEMGPISPSVFIPVADDCNLSARVGEWALERACRDAAAWPGDIRVSVNVSAQHFFSGSLPATVEEVLERTGLRANRLELEITEGVFMGEEQQVDAALARLRKRGVRLSLDDFGTGAFLARLPAPRAVRQDQDRPVLRARLLRGGTIPTPRS